MPSAFNDAPNHSKTLVDANAVASHVKQLLRNAKPPELSPELALINPLPEIHNHLLAIRQALGAFASGNFTAPVRRHGFLGVRLNDLQENMRTLLHQIQQVESGDLDQRVEFIGEFATTFNSMVEQLGAALAAYQAKEAQLATLGRELQRELEKRSSTLDQLARSEERFKYLAEHDPLTGVLNRRSFLSRAELRMHEHAVMQEPCSLALLDVDHFKDFNDTYGHQCGDIALKHLADTISSMLRPSDVLGRYGGEEFIILYANASHEQAICAAERVKKKIEDNPVPLSVGPVTITASFGVVSMPPCFIANEDFNLLEFSAGLADSALYDAKSLGRNRVCSVPFPNEILPLVSARN